jgi:DNA-binding NarL/FixJ family response regulator
MIRIVLADDHQLLRDSMRRAFDAAGESVVGEAADGEEAVELARALQPDIVLMDTSMPGLSGLEATRLICAAGAHAKVVILTMYDDLTHERDALAAGASAYLTKDSSFADVLDSVRRVARGEVRRPRNVTAALVRAAVEASPAPQGSVLSERQAEILQLIARGLSTKQAARELGITQKTVHNHLNAIYRRLDTQSLTHAVLSAGRLGIIELS